MNHVLWGFFSLMNRPLNCFRPLPGGIAKFTVATGIVLACGLGNAVYEFLRGLGVRWYMPGDLGEIVPEQKTIVGYKPTPLYPLSFNLCRQRVRARGTERSAFSPMGQPGFYEPLKFGELMVR